MVRRENMDGIKIYLGEAGWVMVRASGTENLLRVYSETNKPETTRRVLDAVTKVVQICSAAPRVLHGNRQSER